MDWLQAERELFHPTHIDVSESPEGFTIRAEVPGFNAKEMEIGLEGRRLTIAGKREAREEQKDYLFRAMFEPDFSCCRPSGRHRRGKDEGEPEGWHPRAGSSKSGSGQEDSDRVESGLIPCSVCLGTRVTR